jgi:hypothetical protein
MNSVITYLIHYCNNPINNMTISDDTYTTSSTHIRPSFRRATKFPYFISFKHLGFYIIPGSIISAKWD